MFSFLWFLVIGLAAGWIATRLSKQSGGGVLWMMLVGVIGSYVGPLVLGLLGLKSMGFPGSLVSAVVGAIVFIAVLRFAQKNS